MPPSGTLDDLSWYRNLARQQLMHRAGVGCFEQLRALCFVEIVLQGDVSDDLVAGFRFAVLVEL